MAKKKPDEELDTTTSFADMNVEKSKNQGYGQRVPCNGLGRVQSDCSVYLYFNRCFQFIDFACLFLA